MSHDELDSRLDEQLRAAFAPLPNEQLRGLAATAIAPKRSGPAWPALLLTMAALCMLTWVLARTEFREPAPPSPALGSLWVAAFEDATQRGFSNCCDHSCGCGADNFDVGHMCRKRFDAPLRVTEGAKVRLLGAYQGLPTGGCMTLLAQSKEAPVCVFVVPRAEDRDVQLSAEEGLHLDRREVGDLVLYALSKLPSVSPLADFVAH